MKDIKTFEDLREFMEANQHWNWTNFFDGMIKTFYPDDQEFMLTVLYQNLEQSCINHLSSRHKNLPKGFGQYFNEQNEAINS